MKFKNDSHITNVDSIKRLIIEMALSPDKFKNLQVFMHRERENDCNTDYEFLMVTPNSFGKVILQDLTLVNDCVILTIQDCTTGKAGDIRVNISDVNPNVLFVCWQDIKNMVYDDSLSFELNNKTS